MQYAVTFLEGIITFISPCLLPMLPVYISYFAGSREGKPSRTVLKAGAFVLGFTLVFMLMGALAGTVGRLLNRYRTAVNIISGLVVIGFGLNYVGVLKLKLFRGIRSSVNTKDMGVFSAFLFGIIFSVGWTPCVGAFLGSALMLASQRGHAAEGILLLLVYSLGLGIPFLLSALLIDYLKTGFAFIKRHYRIINLISGIFLILVGVVMATGLMGKLLAVLS